MARTFKIETKDGTSVAEGASPLAITGLEPETVVATGDYVAIAVENGVESDSMDIPGFTTLAEEPEVVAVTGVTVDPTSIEDEVGATGTLTVTVEPSDATDKTYTIVSEDETIATVDNTGVWELVAEGTTTFTVTTTDGSFTATVDVVVNAPEPEVVTVTGVELDNETLEVETGATGTLVATVSPDDATDKSVAWTSSDETIATVDSEGVVTGVLAGTADITATTTDGAFTAVCAVTVADPVKKAVRKTRAKKTTK